ncbi:hypothetical protein [Paenibacillus lactis]|uniref:hypothetical protein n=1 Tax=Paenibacillus lactis TaxID=228574 RepID=UPI003D739582
MIVNNLKDLEKMFIGLNKNISNALDVEVTNATREVMKEQIQQVVYEPYDPTVYERQKEVGGLTDEENIKATLKNANTLIIENVRSDKGVNVAEIVESGEGYKYEFPFNGVPRPFSEATREYLENTGIHKEALYRGLKRQGISVESK